MSSPSMFSLSGKTILVTGASSGIGRATALLCAQMGAHVIAGGRDAERLNAVLAELPGDGHQMGQADLTDEAQLSMLLDMLPILDGCVFGAGAAETVPMRMVSQQHLMRMMSINYIAPVMLTQGLLKRKKLRDEASLVYVTAIAEHTAPVATGIYSGAKAALKATVRVLALEHARQKIRANCVSPGYVETPMLERLRLTSSVQDNVGLVPLGILEPVDVASGIAYLLSPASRWVTRSSLVIDGGLTLPMR
ncbi:MAG: SDR family NAD(P)-dependent oxidoreductase [Burkholderiales bacterium]|nr:SDR family NAD(P)-dependent oxidoreductase [Burkholderiales bacterium]